MRIGDLRCECESASLAVDVDRPRLSWRWLGCQRNCRQGAYRILVASNADALDRNEGDVWDSGRVESDDSVMVEYDGPSLAPRRTCHWKVRGWDGDGAATDWSESARWTTGLMGEPWPGKYIGVDGSNGDPEHPLLRKTFQLDEKPVTARAYVNALGYYHLHCNDRQVDDHVLTPAMVQFDKRSNYLVHDVTDWLSRGENVFGLWLGRGWYVEGLPGIVHAGPLVRAFIEMAFADGEVKRVVTDETWRGLPSHYHRLGTWRAGDFGGERVVADERIDGWAAARFDDTGWSGVATPDVSDHVVSAQWVEPNRIKRTFNPIDVKSGEDGAWIVDFGRNVTGFFTMRFQNLAPGREVRFEFLDDVKILNGDDGRVFASEYVAAGVPEETFENKFNYHAFRFVRIHGLDKAPALDDMSASLVRTDFSSIGSFHCSNQTLNAIHDMIHYTFECLSLGGYLVDCPHIERLGYGGDGLASTPTAMTMHGMDGLYRNWMNAWRDCQRSDGDLPHTAPNPYWAGGGPFWCAFVVGAPWNAHLHYADKRILEENYPVMRQWLDGFVKTHRDDDGLLMGWPQVDFRNWYLGDWAMPNRCEKELQNSLHLVINCAIIQCHEWMADVAGTLGEKEDWKRHLQERDRLRSVVHERFYDPKRETYADDTQLDIAYPLLIDVAPKDLRAKLIDRLADKILVEFGGHLDVGLVGVPILTQALMKIGRDDLVFSYVNKRTFPSWGHMLENDATTTWEHWDGKRSRLHNCYNGVGEWFYRAVGGIRPDPASPGFKRFTLKPSIVGDLDHAEARQETSYGTIVSEWRVENGRFDWTVQVPPNATAEIHVPASSVEAVTEGGAPLKDLEGFELIRATDDGIVFNLGSGEYAFACVSKG